MLPEDTGSHAPAGRTGGSSTGAPYGAPGTTVRRQDPVRRVGKKTGPKPRFSRQDVIDAALDIGINSFTMAAVASRLGVAAPAVYRLFDGRDDVTRACLVEVVAEMPRPDEDADWEAVIRHWAERTWETSEKYPGLARLLMSSPENYEHIRDGLQSMLTTVVDRGFTPGQAAFALDLVLGMTLSSFLGGSSVRSAVADVAVAAEAQGREFDRSSMERSDREIFEYKLQFIIDGMKDHCPDI